MEILSLDGLKRHWRRRGYQRMDSGGKRQIRVVRLGGNASGTNRKRGWRLRAIRKLRLRILSPVKILRRIRDAYMDAMLRLAGNGVGSFGGKRVPRGRVPPAKSGDFEARLIMEICRSIAASKELSAARELTLSREAAAAV